VKEGEREREDNNLVISMITIKRIVRKRIHKTSLEKKTSREKTMAKKVQEMNCDATVRQTRSKEMQPSSTKRGLFKVCYMIEILTNSIPTVQAGDT
jgi:hypothetical protein